MLKNIVVVNEISDSELSDIIDYYNNGVITTLSIILDEIEITRLIKKYKLKDLILLDTVQLENLKDNDIIVVENNNTTYLISKNYINDKFLLNL